MDKVKISYNLIIILFLSVTPYLANAMQEQPSPEQQAHTIGEQVHRLIRQTRVANGDEFTKQHIITAIKNSANTIATLNVPHKPYAASMSNALFYILTTASIDMDRHREEIALEIVKAGMDNTLRDTEGNTPLMVAAKRGYRKIAELLLLRGAQLEERDIHAINQESNTALKKTSQNHLVNWTDFLLPHGAKLDKDDIHTTNQDGNTPLMNAIKNQQFYWAELLLKSGATIHSINKNKQTAYSIAKTLYEPGITILRDAIKEWHGLLRTAIRSNDYPAFKKYLLKIGTVHVKGTTGSNLLHYAMASGNIRFVLTIFALAPGLIAQPDKTKGIPLRYWLGFDPQLNLVKALLASDGQEKKFMDALHIPQDMLETEKKEK